VDTYLEIAEKVLLAARRPMSPKGIVDAAYRARIVPSHLYGKTQHKTLQARLSEDILRHRNGSKFYRTEPGMFFLSSLVSDTDVPEKFKQPFSARRRTRDLMREPVLALKNSFLQKRLGNSLENWNELLRAAEKADAIKFVDARRPHEDFAIVWSFSVVRRSHFALSYRIGRYRDDRDNFANKRTIGFPSLVSLSDQSLFSLEDYGATSSALEALLLDLDISRQAFEKNHDLKSPSLSRVMSVDNGKISQVILLVMEWQCPDWFEPTTRRLSLNDPLWWDVSVPPNNRDSFEYWSLSILDAFPDRRQGHCGS
jgi:hypothetical protein